MLVIPALALKGAGQENDVIALQRILS